MVQLPPGRFIQLCQLAFLLIHLLVRLVGTPTGLSTITTYTVYANNTGGSATTTIDITVNDEIPSSISYTGSPYVETIGSSMTTGTPTFLGGTVLTWEVHPSLPTGLSIDSSTGEISVHQLYCLARLLTPFTLTTLEVVEQQLLILPSLILFPHLYHTPEAHTLRLLICL